MKDHIDELPMSGKDDRDSDLILLRVCLVSFNVRAPGGSFGFCSRAVSSFTIEVYLDWVFDGACSGSFGFGA